MNSFVVIAAALSMMVAIATSSPCSDVCMGSCTLAKQNCDGAVVLDPLCNAAFAGCAAGCGAVCGCDDACDAQCQPEFTACKDGSAGNPIFMVQCAVNYDACTVQCQAGCAIQTAVNTIGAVMGGGAK